VTYPSKRAVWLAPLIFLAALPQTTAAAVFNEALPPSLQPTPAPSSLILMLSCLGLLGLYHGRRVLLHRS